MSLPQPTDDRLEFGEPLQCGERVDRGVLLAAAQDLPDHGMDRVRLGGKEVAEFDQPFRHPRTLVEQGTGGQERFERYVDDGGHAAELLAEGQVRAAHLVVAEELQLVDGRQPDPDVRAVVARPAPARPRVVVVAGQPSRRRHGRRRRRSRP